MKKTNTQEIVITSMMAALCCVATMIIKIPTPPYGYINLGDCVVLLCGWLLSPWYAFFAAGAGSALADIFSGYMVYTPATFFIKGLMAIIFNRCLFLLGKKSKNKFSIIVSGIIAELTMVTGYFLFEGFLYGFLVALTSVPGAFVQGTFGLILGVLLIKLFEKTKMFNNF